MQRECSDGCGIPRAHGRETSTLEPSPTSQRGFLHFLDGDERHLSSVVRSAATLGVPIERHETAAAFLESYQPIGPSVLVLEARLPDRNGLDLQRELTAWRVSPVVVFLARHATIRLAVAAMQAGAFTFLEKPVEAPDFRQTLRDALALAAMRWEHRDRQRWAESRLASLKPNERDVLERIAHGKTNREIADELGCSVRTVEDRRARVLRKTGHSTRAELREILAAAQGPASIACPNDIPCPFDRVLAPSAENGSSLA